MKRNNIIILLYSLLIMGILLTGCDDDLAEDTESEKIAISNNSIVVENLIENNGNQLPVINTIGASESYEAEDSDSDLDDTLLDEAIEDEEQINMEEPDIADQLDDSQTEDNQEAEAESTLSEAATQVASGAVALDMSWKYADYSAINSGSAIMYRASDNRKNIVIGVNAGHGTKGGSNVKTYSHPDMTPKVTGGTTAAGSVKSAAVSGGMSFNDGTSESSVTLREAQILRDKLLSRGYDVLMIRDGSDVQLDNIARTVICNNNANCHIAIHWDGDNLSYDKGCFYISTPDGIKNMEPVASTWTRSEALGQSLISGLKSVGCKIYNGGSMAIDLTQTSFSTIPSVDIELGNASSNHDDASLAVLADGLCMGIDSYYY